MYVALTRAEERLYLSHTSRRYMYGGSQYQTPSRFCRELGILTLEEVKKPENSFSRNNSYGGYKSSGYSSREYGDNLYKSYTAPEKVDNSGIKFFNHADFMKKEEKKEEKPLKDVSIFKVGQTLIHPKYGEGKLVEITPDGLVGDIVFSVGKKSLMLELAPLEIKE